jgi:hypothetical protein
MEYGKGWEFLRDLKAEGSRPGQHPPMYLETSVTLEVGMAATGAATLIEQSVLG